MEDQPLELGGQSPYSSYRLLSLTFGAGILGVACSRAARETFYRPMAVADFATAAVATHKLAQILTRERVTMALRSPFTLQRDEGRSGERREVPKEHGFHRAVGELLTCPYCLTPWISGALVTSYIFAPKPTRAVMTVFALTAASDWLSQRWTRQRKS